MTLWYYCIERRARMHNLIPHLLFQAQENKEKLDRVLGPTLNKGNQMSQAVLAASGKVIPHRTVHMLTVAELVSETEKGERVIFDDMILKKFGELVRKPEVPISDYMPYTIDDEEDLVKLPDDNDPVDEKGKSVFEKPITDQCINAKQNLPQGELL
eukprot:14650896-Ditylum_brightwellii.AAC.2